MSAETGRRAVDAIFRSAIRHGSRQVKLKYAGGEASLNAPVLLGLHDYARQKADRCQIDLDAVLLSNGVALGRRLIAALKQRGIRVMISLDGVAAVHDRQRHFPGGRGSFGAVARSLDRLQGMGVTPFVSITLSARNLDGLPQTAAYLVGRELPFGMSFYRENGRSTAAADLRFDEQRLIQTIHSALDVLEAQPARQPLPGSLLDRASFQTPHRWPCGAGLNYLAIGPAGQVAKCQMQLEHPVTSVAADDPLAAVRSARAGLRNPPVEEKDGCRECAWRYWCAGGCPLETYHATGRYDARSPHCAVYQALFPRVLRLFNLHPASPC
jgi:uncharacterized protein